MKILWAMTAATPFLAIRIIFSVLGAFAPVPTIGGPPNTNSLSKFNSITGSWVPLLFMSLAEEFIYICIFCFAAFAIHKSSTYSDDDEKLADRCPGRRGPNSDTVRA
jgi:hypothetical protein